MKILIDIGHPAHVHLFRNFAHEMVQNGHQVLFTTRDKEMAIYLLNNQNFNFISLGKPFKGLTGKLLGLIKFNFQLLNVALNFKPDYFLSHGSMYAAHVAFLLKKPHISFEDTGNMEQIYLYKPFTKAILVSDSFKKIFDKQIVYKGYHELAYLHPNYFKPDKNVLKKYNLSPDSKIILLRFVSWNATHDVSHKGLSILKKIQIAKKFSEFGTVLISSEKDLPEELIPFKINIAPEDIFHVMAYCALVFGESGTMASEAAVLGVPAVYIDSTSRDYTQEQEKKFGLVYNFSEDEKSVDKAMVKGLDILKSVGAIDYLQRRDKLLKEKIDVTSFLVWFVSNYPESQNSMLINPEFQMKFQ
jgi:uncharacterized protein